MGWLTPRTADRRPGTPGVIILLADATGSISPVNKRRIRSEAEAILRRVPGSRLWAFGTVAVDITSDPSRLDGSISECFAGLDLDRDNQRGTYIGRALAQASKLRPERTIVLSDGGTEDRWAMMRTADDMTGAIDAYYCHPRRDEYQLEHHFISSDALWRRYSQGASKSTMQELARRGGGRFSEYPSADGIYTDYGIRDAIPMGHERKVFVGGPTFNIEAPQNEVHRVTRRIDVMHDTEVHHHYGEAQHIHHGEAEAIDIQSGQAQINVARPEGQRIEHHQAPEPPRSLLRTIFLGPGKSQYRGELQSAPARPSLPAPGGQQAMAISYFSKTKVR